jgi:hypothetical protein
MSMSDGEVLESARKLVRKYLHPSRLGQVPNDSLRTSMEVTDVLLSWVAQRAREDTPPPPSSRAGGGHLVDIEPAEPERTGSPRSVERDLYGEEPPDPQALGAVLGFRPLRPPQPGYHGEGELADFDPETGRSSRDDWGRDS